MIDPQLKIRSVTLGVGELERSSDFYARVLGIPRESGDTREAVHGPEGSPGALRLVQLDHPRPAPAGSAGLFHVAWLHPDRAALAETLRRVVGAGWRIDGASDHGVSEALYLSDSDGLGIELYADRPREAWAQAPDGHGIEMVTLPLDLDDLLAQFPGEPGPRIASGTVIGHVHLKVSDVERAAAFYGEEGVGFQEMARIRLAAFLAAGGYHHHLGLNAWHSRGGEPAPADAPGLQAVEFALPDAAALDDVARHLAGTGAPVRSDDGTGFTLHDPDGQLLRFSAA
jgi:catechol 2,3-dioxygenase